MEKYCDLHTHSVFSDGTCTPAEIISLAEDAGLSAVALCDHNTVAGLPDFQAAARTSTVEAVAGIELSTEYLNKDLHIVGLYIRPEFYGDISARMEDYSRRKTESNMDLCEGLCRHGYPITYEEICARFPGGNVNRAHFAALLTEKGFASSVRDAFDSILGEEIGIYHPPKRFEVLESIAYLKSLGAVPILAHPFLDLKEDELEVFLPVAKEAGLAGMETIYSTFDAAERALASRIAEKHGLLPSGGSDFHGENKPDICIGRGRGDLFVPFSYLEDIRKKLQ